MPARDELEAMRARIEALERELSDTEVDREKERLVLQRQLAEAQLELARANEREHEREHGSTESPAPSGPPSKGKRWLALIPVVVIGVVIAGYVGSRPSFEGSLEVRSGGEAWTLQPTACRSGDGAQPEYFGASLRDARGGSARIEPARVVVTRPSGDPITLHERDCEVFDVHIEWGSARVEHVESVDGHARLDCTLDDETRVRGTLEFQTCSL